MSVFCVSASKLFQTVSWQICSEFCTYFILNHQPPFLGKMKAVILQKKGHGITKVSRLFLLLAMIICTEMMMMIIIVIMLNMY